MFDFGTTEAPPAPKYGRLIKASQKQSRVSRKQAARQRQWARKQHKQDQAKTQKATKRSLDILRNTQQDAQRDRRRYERMYQPLERDLIADARRADNPATIRRKMGRAMAGVGQQFDAARDAALRQLEGYGINPSATRFAALDIGTRVDEAAAKAAAGENARETQENLARALRSEAINIGRGYPGQVAGAYNVGVGAGQAAVGGVNQTTMTGANTMGTGVQYGGLYNQNAALQGNLMHQGYSDTLAGYTAQQQYGNPWASTLGTVAGAAANIYMNMDEGGAIPIEASPSAGAVPDDVPTALTAGEFVMPREAVEWYGQKHFVGLIEKANKERASALPI